MYYAVMRVTISLEQDLLRQAKAVARADATSLSAAISRLLRKALASDSSVGSSLKMNRRGVPVVECDVAFSSSDVAALDE